MRRSFRGGLVAVFLVAVLPLFTCRNGRQAEMLDRETALNLLREGTEESYRGLTWSAPLTVFVTSPAEERLVAVLQGLTPDLLILRSQGEAPDPNPSFDPFAKKRLVKKYDFGLVKPELAVRGPFGPEEARLRLADTEFKEVTRITQQGNQATAEVAVAYAPNETYRRIEKAMAGAKPDGAMRSSYQLPEPQVVGRTGTQRFGFVRYDDGWRLHSSLF